MPPLDERATATLAAVLERLIPADELGPGAVGAGVLDYVLGALAGPYAVHVPRYAAGLAALAAFAELEPAAQDELLERLENDDRVFFDLVRQHAVEGMFSDPSHGGNADFAGWRLLGYPGPKRTFTEADQRLDIDVERTYG